MFKLNCFKMFFVVMVVFLAAINAYSYTISCPDGNTIFLKNGKASQTVKHIEYVMQKGEVLGQVVKDLFPDLSYKDRQGIIKDACVRHNIPDPTKIRPGKKLAFFKVILGGLGLGKDEDVKKPKKDFKIDDGILTEELDLVYHPIKEDFPKTDLIEKEPIFPKIPVLHFSEKYIPSKKEAPPKKEIIANLDGVKFVKVKKGDTVWDIAQTHNLTVKQIAEWSFLDNPDNIVPGDLLFLEPPPVPNIFEADKIRVRALAESFKSPQKSNSAPHITQVRKIKRNSNLLRKDYFYLRQELRVPMALASVRRYVEKKHSPEYVFEIVKHMHDASKEFGVDLDAIAALARIESCFNYRLVSEKKAKGIMQGLDSTFEPLGCEDMFDARQNIFAGTKYFKKLYKRFDNNLELALAAYNSGPTRVEKLGRVPNIEETKKFIEKFNKLYKGTNILISS